MHSINFNRFKLKMEHTAAAYAELLEKLEAVREVITRFDGKVINKRFTDALKVIDSGFHVKCDEWQFEINWYIPQNIRGYRVGECTEYIDNHDLNIFTCYYNNEYLRIGKCVIDGRLVAEKAAAYLDAGLVQLEKSRKDAETAIVEFHNWEQDMQQLQEQYQTIRSSYPYFLIQLFDIRGL